MSVFYAEYSAVGSAFVLGTRGRVFESHYSELILPAWRRGSAVDLGSEGAGSSPAVGVFKKSSSSKWSGHLSFKEVIRVQTP